MTIRSVAVLLQGKRILHTTLIKPDLIPALLRLHNHLHHLELILLDLPHHLELLHISAIHLTSLTCMMAASLTLTTFLLNNYCLWSCCQLAFYCLINSCIFGTFAKRVRVNYSFLRSYVNVERFRMKISIFFIFYFDRA
jgi:hypothetical protein